MTTVRECFCGCWREGSSDPADVRACFAAAAEGFVSGVGSVADAGDDVWTGPGLGEWTVRDLVGHTSRALSTIETYLADPPDEIVVTDPVDYLLAVRQFPQGGAAIAERGRQAGAALGSDPPAAVAALASRVRALVAATPDEAPLRLVLGGATLVTYLPTRTFELTVHTLDLARPVGVAPARDGGRRRRWRRRSTGRRRWRCRPGRRRPDGPVGPHRARGRLSAGFYSILRRAPDFSLNLDALK